MASSGSGRKRPCRTPAGRENKTSPRLGEGHVQLDPRHVRLMHDGGLRHVALEFSALRGEQVPARGVLTQNLPGPGNFEPLRDGFPRLTTRNWLRHEARKIGALFAPDNWFP